MISPRFAREWRRRRKLRRFERHPWFGKRLAYVAALAKAYRTFPSPL
jgi:hypothetical protein